MRASHSVAYKHFVLFAALCTLCELAFYFGSIHEEKLNTIWKQFHQYTNTNSAMVAVDLTVECNRTYYELWMNNLTDTLIKEHITMVGVGHWKQMQQQIEYIVDNGIEGDLYETGIWKGGTSIFIYSAMTAYEKCKNIKSNRHFWFFDSFEGFAIIPTDQTLSNYLQNDRYIANYTNVQANFQKFNALQDNVHLVKGYFEDTIPTHATEIDNKISMLRLDGDLYSSTKVVLDYLFDRVAPRGFVIIDDYGWIPPTGNNRTKYCKHAVDEFMIQHHYNASKLLKNAVYGLKKYFQKPE